MNLDLCRIALRPRSPLDVFDLTMTFLRARPRPFLRLLLVIVGPLWVAVAVASVLLDGHWGLLAVPLVLSPVIQAPFTVFGGRAMFSERVRVRSVLRDTARAAPTLVATWMIAGAGWILAAITCFYGTPFIQAGVLFLTESALLERVGAGRCLRRSLRLAGAHILVALTGAVARWFLTAWFAALAELTAQFLLDYVLQLGSPFGALQDGVVTPWVLLGMLVAQPVFAVYRLLLYVDVRTRVEGWDLQVGLMALKHRSEAA